VGRRKAADLLEAGARVLGVDPAARAEMLPAGIELRVEPYCADHLDGRVLAVAAAPAAVNRRVVADARRARVWVSSASDPGAGDFTRPATRRAGRLAVAVTTGGASPALAAALRDRAAAALGTEAAALTALLAELRPLVRQRLPDPRARRRLFTAWADPRWLRRCRDDGPEAVRAALLAALDEAAGR
jgi:siroheme synthase-like protein